MSMQLPSAPPLQRRLVQPFRVVGLLLGLVALPTFSVVSGFNAEANRSVLHVAISFAALMLGFRLIGKRELGRLSPFELVTLMLIPEILSGSVQGQDSVAQSLAGLCTVLFLVTLVSVLSQRFPKVQGALEASPTLLVSQGKLLDHNMNSERIAPEELFSEMRKQGLAELSEVRFAVLEGGGNITFVPRKSGGGASEQDAS